MADDMMLRWEETSAGKVTRATYTGPCGSRMAASFAGWMDKKAVQQTLERFRRIAATVPMWTARDT